MKGLSAYLRFVALLVVCMESLPVDAQSTSFLSLQTENGQPFELRWNGKIQPSSADGSLVLQDIPVGKQSFTIVFPGEVAAENIFNVVIDESPKAYSLRLWMDNSWSLFDLVDLTYIKGEYKEIVATPVMVKLPGQPVVPVQPAPVVEKAKLPIVTAITRIFDRSGSGGIDQVYIVTTEKKVDTIALFIPVLEDLPKSGTNPSAHSNPELPATNTAGLYLQVPPVPVRSVAGNRQIPTNR